MHNSWATSWFSKKMLIRLGKETPHLFLLTIYIHWYTVCNIGVLLLCFIWSVKTSSTLVADNFKVHTPLSEGESSFAAGSSHLVRSAKGSR